MLPSLSEQLTTQFYKWEQLGRGWLWCEQPADLEPPFYPFFFHETPPVPYADDGYRPNIFSRIGKLFKSKEPIPEAEEDDEIVPYIFGCNEPLEIFSVSLPKGYKVDAGITKEMLLMLSNARYPISFEIVAGSDSIVLQFACRETDSRYAQSQVKAYFPECIIKSRPDLVEEILDTDASGSIVDLGLHDEFMRPLNMADTFIIDPFIGLFGGLEHLDDGEHIVIQVLFQGCINPWSESILRSVTDFDGKAFFADAPEMVPLTKEKISSPLFGVVIKVLAAAETMERALTLSDHTVKAIARLYFSPHNSLIPLLSNLPFETRVSDFLLRESHRVGMLLNVRELVTLVHFPSQAVVSARLERDTRKTKAAPAITQGHALILGLNEHQGKTKKVSVSDTQRLKHTHIIGATGTGKSTFILSLIVQDILNGKGIGVLDPHGDLIEGILPYIPKERFNDVLVIDPADSDYPVGFNILSAHSNIEKEILSTDLVAGFKRLSTSWGDQMNSVLANAILAYLESKEGGTLADLRRFLIEKPYRDSFLKTVADPHVVYYWQKEFPLLKTSSIGSILTRLDTFLRPKLIRNMVGQKKGLDFEHILDTKKILLVKLSHGLIGEDNSYLLGTMIVSKIYQAAMARQAKAKDARSDFFLYIDEFQNFITPSMSSILSGARKYHLGLILAHQDMQQLVKHDSALASTVVSNAGTRICFRLGDTDARRFASGFSFFEAEDLENLNTGEAIARIERPEYDFSLSTESLPDIDVDEGEDTKKAVIDCSREQYGTPWEKVEIVLQHVQADIQPEPDPPIVESKDIHEPPAQPTTAKLPVEILEPVVTEDPVKRQEVTQHRYLQTLIKKMADSRGFKSLIEELTPDGKGRVDVSLERNGKRIAVEICVTTDAEWEVHNIQKCADAGYDVIVACSNEKKTLENIRRKAETRLSPSIQQKLSFFEPEGLFAYLDAELAKEASTEVRMKGYRIKTEYSPVSTETAEHMNTTIMKTVTDATKKKKNTGKKKE